METVERRASLLLFALFLVSCVVEDAEEGWDCYLHTETGVCDCFQGEDDEYADTNIENVDACEGYSRCYAYLDEVFEEPMCSCGDSDYSPNSGSTDVAEVETCPE